MIHLIRNQEASRCCEGFVLGYSRNQNLLLLNDLKEISIIKIDLIKNILTDFENGDTKKIISERYDIHRETVRKCIKKYGTVVQLRETTGLSPVKYGFDSIQTYMVLDNPEYAYLLGMYFGDGYICKSRRTYKLRIFIHSSHEILRHKILQTISVIFPDNKVNWFEQKNAKCVEIYLYNNNLPLIFPQHGKGLKHTRLIQYTDWQQNIVKKYPESFISGLLDSDGSSYIQTNTKLRYYSFRNTSKDIKQMFIDSCIQLGINCKPDNNTTVYIRKKEDVKKLESFYSYKQ